MRRSPHKSLELQRQTDRCDFDDPLRRSSTALVRACAWVDGAELSCLAGIQHRGGSTPVVAAMPVRVAATSVRSRWTGVLLGDIGSCDLDALLRTLARRLWLAVFVRRPGPRQVCNRACAETGRIREVEFSM
jgi:hypothetical protein